MCLVVFIACAFYLIGFVFMGTARLLLPWTISATVLAGLVVLCLIWLFRSQIQRKTLPLIYLLMLGLTFGFGYLGWTIKSPSPPPLTPKKEGLTAVLDFFISGPEYQITLDDLWTMLPYHLFVSGLIGGLIVHNLVKDSWEPEVDKTNKDMLANEDT